MNKIHRNGTIQGASINSKRRGIIQDECMNKIRKHIIQVSVLIKSTETALYRVPVRIISGATTLHRVPRHIHCTLLYTAMVLCNAVSLQFSSTMCGLKETKPIKRSAQIHKEAQLFIQNKHTTVTKQEHRV
jgi:hypothetical protein